MGVLDIKHYCKTKEKFSTLRPPTEWEKVFASYTSNMGLITRIYRDLKKLNSPKINEPIQKWVTELKGIFQRKKSKWPKNT
jgi:hypothetical protein